MGEAPLSRRRGLRPAWRRGQLLPVETFNKELGDFHALEEEMATHSSALAWRIPGKGEPGGLPSMGSHRVRDN